MRRAAMATLLFVLGVAPSIADDAGQVVQISHVTGKPVPRFETLRYAAVNGRTGPSEDHSIAWRYERRGLPVLILKESRNWARVRDPEGDEVWVHRRTLEEGDTAFVQTRTLLRAAGNMAARPLAEIEPGVLVTRQACVERYCEIEVDGTSGWVLGVDLWGVGLERQPD